MCICDLSVCRDVSVFVSIVISLLIWLRHSHSDQARANAYVCFNMCACCTPLRVDVCGVLLCLCWLLLLLCLYDDISSYMYICVSLCEYVCVDCFLDCVVPVYIYIYMRVVFVSYVCVCVCCCALLYVCVYMCMSNSVIVIYILMCMY